MLSPRSIIQIHYNLSFGPDSLPYKKLTYCGDIQNRLIGARLFASLNRLILYKTDRCMKIIKYVIQNTQKEISQYRVFFYLSLIVFVFTIAVYIFNPTVFLRFTGDINPLIILLFSIFSGYFLFIFLNSKASLAIYKKHRPISYLIITGISLLFGIEIIVADIWIVDYPKGINVLFPDSLLFYPAIGYMVEILFHLLPLSTIIFLLTSFSKLRMNKIIWISIVIVSLIEPAYQIQFASQSSLITVIYTSIHVFLFSLVQLMIFKRFDFISMYFFRIIFYIIWHIVWGQLRIDLLF